MEGEKYVDFVNKITSLLKSKLGATGYTLVSASGMSSGQMVQHLSTHIIPTYSANSVELPMMNILQTQRVPPTVLAELLKKLKA